MKFDLPFGLCQLVPSLPTRGAWIEMAWAATAWRSITPLPSRGQGRALFCQEEPRWRGRGQDVGEALANAGSRAMFPPAHDGWVGAQQNLTTAAAGNCKQSGWGAPGCGKGCPHIQTVLGERCALTREESCGNPCANPGAVCTHLSPALQLLPRFLFPVPSGGHRGRRVKKAPQGIPGHTARSGRPVKPTPTNEF